MPIAYVTHKKDRQVIDTEIVLLAQVAQSRTGKDLRGLVDLFSSEYAKEALQYSGICPNLKLIGDVVFVLENSLMSADIIEIKFLLEFIRKNILLDGALSCETTVDITTEY